MKTVAFYSYKGGVGRSLALAYTARYLAENNFNVCVLDADLEAPGILYKFEPAPDHRKLGLVDYIHKSITDKPPETISDYFYTYQKSKYSYIKVMSAGQGLEGAYWDKLADIDWNELFLGDNNIGLFVFEALKYQIKTQINPDYLLIDSRSGVTVMSKLCNSVLPDTVIMLMANNRENFHGSKLMYRHIFASKYKTNKQKTEIFCSLTRVPLPREGDSSEVGIVDNLLHVLGIPTLTHSDITIIHSDRDVEKDEHIVLQRGLGSENDGNIQGDYYKLITKIVSLEMLEVKRNIIINDPKYYFIAYDIKPKIEKILSHLRKDKSVESFLDEIETKVENEFVSCENLYSLAVCKRFFDNPIDAIACLSKAISIGIGDNNLKDDVFYLRGMIFLYDLNNYSEAINDLITVYQPDEGLEPYFLYDKSLPYDISVCLLCLGRFGESLRFIDTYLKKNDSDSKGYVLRANIAYRQLRKDNKINQIESRGKVNMILVDLAKAITLNNQYAYAYISRGNLFNDLGEINEALMDYDKAIELNPNYAATYNNRGSIFHKKPGHYNEALDDYSKAIELNPNYAIAYYNRGILFSEKPENYNKALDDYDKAIELNPNYADAYNNRGILFSKKIEHYNKALDDYNKAIELNPNYADAYNNRGNLFSKKPEYYNEALDDYNKAIELNLNCAEAYYNRGILFSGKPENYNKALDDYNKAIELNPNYADAYNNRGNLFSKKPEHCNKALDDYNKAIELNPNFADAYNNRGALFFEKPEYYNDALEDYNKAIELCPNDAVLYNNRGALFSEKLERNNKALDDFNRAIELNPDYADAYFNRSYLYRKLGNKMEADEDRKRYYELTTKEI